MTRPTLIVNLAAALAFAGSLLANGPVQAGADGAGNFVQSLADRAIAASRSERPDRKVMAGLIDEGMDIEGIARFALGPFARQAKPNHVSEYLETFRRYVLMVYPDQLLKLNVRSFKVTGLKNTEDGLSLVTTHIVPIEGDPYNMGWYVKEQKPGKYKVQDVQYESHSLRSYQRAKFEKILRDRSIDGLTRVLESWIKAGREEPYF